MDEVLTEIITIIKDTDDLNSKINADEIKADHHIQKDLGFDSLALMSLVYELQEKYEDLDETKLNEWHRLEDLISEIKKL